MINREQEELQTKLDKMKRFTTGMKLAVLMGSSIITASLTKGLNGENHTDSDENTFNTEAVAPSENKNYFYNGEEITADNSDIDAILVDKASNQLAKSLINKIDKLTTSSTTNRELIQGSNGDIMNLVNILACRVTKQTGTSGIAVENNDMAPSEIYKMMKKIDKGFIITAKTGFKYNKTFQSTTFLVSEMPKNYQVELAKANMSNSPNDAYAEILQKVKCISLSEKDEKLSFETTSLADVINNADDISCTNVAGIISNILSKDANGNNLPTNDIVKNINKAGINVTQGDGKTMSAEQFMSIANSQKAR